MAPRAKRLARRGKRARPALAKVTVIYNRQEEAAMTDRIRVFTLSRVSRTNRQISDVLGRIGTWPFRRDVSYHVGVNCDSIVVSAGKVIVQRRGRVIAAAPVQGLLEPSAS
jgi:hypothetical protein